MSGQLRRRTDCHFSAVQYVSDRAPKKQYRLYILLYYATDFIMTRSLLVVVVLLRLWKYYILLYCVDIIIVVFIYILHPAQSCSDRRQRVTS